MLYLSQEKWRLTIATMTRRLKLVSHTQVQIKVIPVTYLDKLIPSLALFGFVFLCINAEANDNTRVG